MRAFAFFGVYLYNMTNEWKRLCPSCNRELFYSSKYKLSRAIFEKSCCSSCVNRHRTFSIDTRSKMAKSKLGKPSPLRGIPLSEETRKKISTSQIGKIVSNYTRQKMSASKVGCKSWNNGIHYSVERRKEMSECAKIAMHRPEVRKRHIESLMSSQWLKVKTDKGQLELIEKWNKLGFQFHPNYPLKGNDFLYYLDGYDPILNVVLEYDGAYHFRKSNDIKRKDIIREQNIINLLQPKKFWRYNAVERTWKNICLNNAM